MRAGAAVLLVVGAWLAIGGGVARSAPISFTSDTEVSLCSPNLSPVACQKRGVSTIPYGGALADLTGNGNRDLVVATPEGVAVLLGDGAGGFSDPQLVPGSPAPANDVAEGQLDGHEGSDVVVGTTTGITIMRSDGQGGLTTDQSIDLGGSATDINISGLGRNGKGRREIAAIVTEPSGASHVAVLLGQGQDRFASPVQVDAAENPESLAVADLTHRGIPDLIVGTSTGITVFRANGAGHFAPPRSASACSFAPQLGQHEIRVGDLNGDDNPDVVDGNYWCAGDGRGGLGAPIQLVPNGVGPDALGDFAGDGRPDLVLGVPGFAGLFGRQWSVLAGNGDGTFVPPLELGFGGPSYRVQVFQVIVGDLNGDGRPDLIFLSTFHTDPYPLAGTVTVMLNTSP